MVPGTGSHICNKSTGSCDVECEVQLHPTNTQLDWDLGRLGAKSKPWCLFQDTKALTNLFGRAQYPVDRKAVVMLG